MIGETQNASLSAYAPSLDVVELTKTIKKDYAEGVRILETSWTELNDRSVLEDENNGELMLNQYVDESITDENEAWQWRGTRGTARKKGIAMHANLTANYLLPLFIAQNDNDEVDKDFSELMRDGIEWMAQPTNSNYGASFIQVVMSMLSSPVVYLGAEYAEVYQKIKNKTDQGYEVKEILDEVLSGFQAPVLSASQVLITNAYERNIQKQRCIIKRRYCEKQELEAKYGEHENWIYLKEGLRSVYSDEDGLFYDVKDDEHPHLIAEETPMYRRDDSEFCFLNGIYFGNANVDENPIKHRDNRNTPKYNVTPFGYSRIGKHFFYYKSAMNVWQWDDKLIDAMYEVGMNDEFLRTNMPIAISGNDKVDSEILFPKAVIAFEDKDTRVTPLLPPRQGNILQAMPVAEASMTEASVNETISGQLPDASQKAYSVAQAQANAKKILGSVGKSIAESVIFYGDLMKDIFVNHITVPQVEELTGGRMKLKYKTLFLENKAAKGQVADKIIKFDESLIGLSMTKDEKKYRELELLKESGYPERKRSLRLVNPLLFAKFKYLCKADVEEMFAKSLEYMQGFLLSLRRELMNDPFIDIEKLDRKVMYAHFQSEGDDFIKEQASQNPLQTPTQGPLTMSPETAAISRVASKVI